MGPLTIWMLIAAVTAIDVVWATSKGLSLAYNPIFAIVALCIWFVCSRLRRGQNIAALAMALAQLHSILLAVGVLTYLSITTGASPIDAQLAAIDRQLGFDWPAILAWTMQHDGVWRFLSFCYWSLITQVLVLLVILSVMGRRDRIMEFVCLFTLSLVTCALIAFALPADSAWSHYGVTNIIDAYHLPHLYDLRSGRMTTIDTSKIYGMITFPSFHASLGVLLIYATRGIPLL